MNRFLPAIISLDSFAIFGLISLFDVDEAFAAGLTSGIHRAPVYRMVKRNKPVAGKTPLCISYLRFSKLEQKKGDSIRRQIALSQDWAKSRGLTVDDSFRDDGVSAFRGRNVSHGSLGRIIKLIEDGTIPKGSFLLVEALDRITRSEVGLGVQLFLQIINSGVTIVTVGDGNEYTSPVVMEKLMYSVMLLSTSHEESKKKSLRNIANWEQKRKLAREGTKPLTKMVPGWIVCDGGKMSIDAAKAKPVRQIFKLARDGMGLGSITRKLNRDGTLPIGTGDRWHSTYVHKILRDRAAIGELIMHRFVNGKRTPIETVPDYYPPVVPVADYEAANAALDSRRNQGRKYGGPSSKFCNVFNGLLYDIDGEPFTTYSRRDNRYIVSLGALLGTSERQINLRQDVFEAAFFDTSFAWFANDFSPKADGSAAAELDDLKAELAETENRISQIQDQVVASGTGIASVVNLLGRLEEKKSAVETKIIDLRATSTLTDADRLHKLVRTYGKLARGALGHEDREQLAAVLRGLVKRIELDMDRDGRDIIGACTIVPVVGKSFGFAFRFNPYTNDKSSPALARLIYSPVRMSSGDPPAGTPFGRDIVPIAAALANAGITLR